MCIARDNNKKQGGRCSYQTAEKVLFFEENENCPVTVGLALVVLILDIDHTELDNRLLKEILAYWLTEIGKVSADR